MRVFYNDFKFGRRIKIALLLNYAQLKGAAREENIFKVY
jgi:hypothetical protein